MNSNSLELLNTLKLFLFYLLFFETMLQNNSNVSSVKVSIHFVEYINSKTSHEHDFSLCFSDCIARRQGAECHKHVN